MFLSDYIETCICCSQNAESFTRMFAVRLQSLALACCSQNAESFTRMLQRSELSQTIRFLLPFSVTPVDMAAAPMDEETCVYGMIIIGSHALGQYVNFVDGILTTTIPDADFERLPPKQVERLLHDPEEGPDFLVLGNGYPSFKYQHLIQSSCKTMWLFAGPGHLRDSMLVKKLEIKSLVFQLFGRMLPPADAVNDNVVEIKVYTMSGTMQELMHFSGLDRIYCKDIEERLRVSFKKGINVRYTFVSAANEILDRKVPLYQPVTRVGNVGKPIRLIKKTSPSEARMLRLIGEKRKS